MKNSQRINSIIDTFAIVTYIFWMVSYFLGFVMINLEGDNLLISEIMTVFLVILVCIRLFQGALKRDYRFLAEAIVGIVISFLSSMGNSNANERLYILFLLIVSMYGMPFKRIVKAFLVTILIGLMTTHLLAILGYIPNLDWGENGRAWGLSYRTGCAGYYLYIFLSIVYLWPKKWSYFILAGISVPYTLFIYFMTKGKTFLIVMVACAVGLMFLEILKINYHRKISSIVISIGEVFCMTMPSLILAFTLITNEMYHYFGREGGLLETFMGTMVSRIRMGYSAIHDYSLTILGNTEVPLLGFGGTALDGEALTQEYFYIDNAYLYLLVINGLLLFVLWAYVVHKCIFLAKKRHYSVILLILCMVCFCAYTEGSVFGIANNPFLLLPFTRWYVKEESVPQTIQRKCILGGICIIYIIGSVLFFAHFLNRPSLVADEVPKGDFSLITVPKDKNIYQRYLSVSDSYGMSIFLQNPKEISNVNVILELEDADSEEVFFKGMISAKDISSEGEYYDFDYFGGKISDGTNVNMYIYSEDEWDDAINVGVIKKTKDCVYGKYISMGYGDDGTRMFAFRPMRKYYSNIMFYWFIVTAVLGCFLLTTSKHYSNIGVCGDIRIEARTVGIVILTMLFGLLIYKPSMRKIVYTSDISISVDDNISSEAGLKLQEGQYYLANIDASRVGKLDVARVYLRKYSNLLNGISVCVSNENEEILFEKQYDNFGNIGINAGESIEIDFDELSEKEDSFILFNIYSGSDEKRIAPIIDAVEFINISHFSTLKFAMVICFGIIVYVLFISSLVFKPNNDSDIKKKRVYAKKQI